MIRKKKFFFPVDIIENIPRDRKIVQLSCWEVLSTVPMKGNISTGRQFRRVLSLSTRLHFQQSATSRELPSNSSIPFPLTKASFVFNELFSHNVCKLLSPLLFTYWFYLNSDIWKNILCNIKLILLHIQSEKVSYMKHLNTSAWCNG